MKNKLFILFVMLVITISCFIPAQSFEEKTNDEEIQFDSESYDQATVIIFGSCNSAYVVGFTWRFGLYIPAVRRTIHIVASGGNESLNAVVLKSNQGFGIYLNNNDMFIRLARTKGIFFWGGKSILTTSNFIFAVCNARYVTISA